jgi:ABC-type transport system substrate-binding protein
MVRRLAVVALGLVMVACGGGGSSATPGSGSSGAPPASDSGDPTNLIVGWGESAISSLDPAIGYDFNSWPAEQLIFESLVGYPEGSTEAEPRLAADMPTISEDGLVYTFTLRDDVSFVNSDGSVHGPMTAADVVFSLNRVLRPDLTPSPSPVGDAFFGVIEGADAVLAGDSEEASGLVALDETTVEITLTQPDGTFLMKLATPFGSVVPADVATTDTEAFSESPVGTGPYVLGSHSIGEEATFLRNAHYWGTPGEADEIVFRMNLDSNVMVEEVETNAIDIIGTTIPAALWPAIRDDPTYEDRAVEVPQLTITYLTMDTSGPESPFADLQVRLAASHAIDREHIVQLLAGQAEVLGCIFPPGLAEGMDCEGYPYDPEAAADLLAASEYPDGFATELYTDNSDDSQTMAQAIQQDLGAIGIDVEIVVQPFDVLLETIATPHAAPLVYIGWFADYPDPSNFYDPILSCATAVEAGANVSWFCDEELDSLAAAANLEQERGARLEAYAELERRTMEQAPWVSVISPVITTLLSERVTHFEPHPVWAFDFARVAVGN